MKTKIAWLAIFAANLLSPSNSNAATVVGASWYQYDSGAQNTPYYTHMKFNADDNDTSVFRIDLNDSGWGFSATSTSSYHVQWGTPTDGGTLLSPLRSVGWHKYEVLFSYAPNVLTFKYDDGVVVQDLPFTAAPEYFWLQYHGFSPSETVLDDLNIVTDSGSKLYTFESPLEFGAEWGVVGQSSGEYVNMVDTSRSHSGLGALAVGQSSGGNDNLAATLNLSSVPEPDRLALVAIFTLGALLRRRR